MIMGSKDNIKDTITSNFRDEMSDVKKLEDKRKLRYYKEVINPTLDNHNYLSMLTNTKSKINITGIRTNSHELQSDTEQWSTPRTRWDDIIFQICDTKKVKDENNFLLDNNGFMTQ